MRRQTTQPVVRYGSTHTRMDKAADHLRRQGRLPEPAPARLAPAGLGPHRPDRRLRLELRRCATLQRASPQPLSGEDSCVVPGPGCALNVILGTNLPMSPATTWPGNGASRLLERQPGSARNHRRPRRPDHRMPSPSRGHHCDARQSPIAMSSSHVPSSPIRSKQTVPGVGALGVGFRPLPQTTPGRGRPAARGSPRASCPAIGASICRKHCGGCAEVAYPGPSDPGIHRCADRNSSPAWRSSASRFRAGTLRPRSR